MSKFGKLIRYYRIRAIDSERDGGLTQARFGELLGDALGITSGYSGVVISLWESGKRRINHADRNILISLVKVLHNCEGIRELREANDLLLAGGYASLNSEEQLKIFGQAKIVSTSDPRSEGIPHPDTRAISEDAKETPTHSVGKKGFLFVTLIVLSLIVILLPLLPQIAIALNNAGYVNYSNDNFSRAQIYYRLASLYPGYSVPHYNLGLLYEYKNDVDAAKQEYFMALDGKLDAAYNNLARLHILEGEYSQAISLLQSGLKIVGEDDEEVSYAMQKNMGWAFFGLGDLNQAEAVLRGAILLKDDRAPAFCLLAQVLEEQGNSEVALDTWESCLKYANGANEDERNWKIMAQQRLDTTQGDK